MALLVGLVVALVALVAAVVVGLRRGPVVGVAWGAGVVAAGALAYCALLALALPM